MDHLLFCIAEEAKPFVRQVLALRDTEDLGPLPLALAESRVAPTHGDQLKSSLGEGETFETDFIGTSEQECQQWALENATPLDFLYSDVIAIVDARSAEDHSILIQTYQDYFPPEDSQMPPHLRNIPPRERYQTWWSFRIDFKDVPDALLDLSEFGTDEAEECYYGYTKQLTDDRGIFNVEKARRIMFGESAETVLNEDTTTARL